MEVPDIASLNQGDRGWYACSSGPKIGRNRVAQKPAAHEQMFYVTTSALVSYITNYENE